MTQGIPGVPGLPSIPDASSLGNLASGLPGVPSVPSLSSLAGNVPSLGSLAGSVPTIPGVNVSGLATGLASGQNLQSLLSQNLSPDALNALQPEAKAYLQQGLSLVSDLGPTYNLIDTVAQGGEVSPQQAITALAGAATLVNPLAGAAVMAAGELATGFESVLQDLGLVSETAKPVPYYGLIPSGDQLPSGGPGSVKPDPTWRTWPQFAFYWWDQIANAEARGWQQGILAPEGSPPAQMTPQSLVIFGLMNSLEHTQGTPPGLGRAKAVPLKGPSGNAFEKFLAPMLQANVEAWANGSPFVDPRQLLLSAIEAWNDKHVSLGAAKAAPSPSPLSGLKALAAALIPTVGADITYSPAEDTNHGVIPFLLGSGGDSTGTARRAGSYTVYMGQRLPTPPAPAAGSPDLGSAQVAQGAATAANAAFMAVLAQHRASAASPAPAPASSLPFGVSKSTAETFALVAAGALVLYLLTRRSP